LVCLGRILFSAVFLAGALGHVIHWQQTVAYAAAQGVPMAPAMVGVATVLAIVGALSVLLGYHAHLGAWLLVLFLVPVTLMMHAFWAAMPTEATVQQAMFFKNLSMLGGALMIAHFGSGPWSVDEWRKAHARQN
jgi:putative oxidoreductase